MGKHNLLQEESEVRTSLEDTASSDQEIDQEPDPEFSFHLSRAQPSNSKHVHAIHRRSKDGLDSQ